MRVHLQAVADPPRLESGAEAPSPHNGTSSRVPTKAAAVGGGSNSGGGGRGGGSCTATWPSHHTVKRLPGRNASQCYPRWPHGYPAAQIPQPKASSVAQNAGGVSRVYAWRQVQLYAWHECSTGRTSGSTLSLGMMKIEKSMKPAIMPCSELYRLAFRGETGPLRAGGHDG